MLLHTLKGNAGTLGATALAQEAARLEALCAGEMEPQWVQGHFDVLEALAQSAYQALRQAIAALDPEPLAPAASTTKDPQVMAALQELAVLLEASDFAALERFAEMRQTLQTLPQELLNSLEDALQNLELDDALQLCRDGLRNG
jgi:two-component system sensor histidine kinase/response regulator